MNKSNHPANVKFTPLRRFPWCFVVSLLLLLALAFYYLPHLNGDVLWMAQNRSLWLSGPSFLAEQLQRPAGLLAYLSLYATQWLVEPWQGMALMEAIWVVTIVLLRRAFAIPDLLSPVLIVPFLAILQMLVGVGYWIYYLKFPGIYFSASVGLLVVALTAWLGSCRRLWPLAYVVGIVLYPLVGIYGSLALALLALGAVARKEKWVWGKAIALLLFAVATPFLWGKLYITIHPDTLFSAGLPRFEVYNTTNGQLIRPLCAALLWMLTLPLWGRWKPKGRKAVVAAAVIQLALVAGGIVTVNQKLFRNPLFHAECRVYHDVQDMRWADAANHTTEVRDSLTRQLIVMKNLALWHLDQLGEHIYDYNDRGLRPVTGDSLQVRLVDVAGPLIYLHHGLTNFARRWTIETTVERGMTVDALKTLTLCALVDGERDAALKYIAMLKRTTFHKAWAERYEPLARDEKRQGDYPELDRLMTLHKELPESMGDDDGLCEWYIVERFSTLPLTQCRPLADLSLAYAMMSKDIQRFWPHYLQWKELNPDLEVPRSYQEAAYLYGTLEPQTAPNPQEYGISFDQERIVARHQAFMESGQQMAQSGLPDEAIGTAIRAEFGDTFWWTYFFVRNSQYY